MRLIKREIKIAVPEGVTVTACKARKISVTGPRGSLHRDFHHIPKLDLTLNEENEVVATMWFASNKLSGSLRTTVSHISNLFDGVTKGFRYKMRAVYAHFPVNINIEKNGTVVEIRNFLGEKRTRVCNMLEGVKSYRDESVKDFIVKDCPLYHHHLYHHHLYIHYDVSTIFPFGLFLYLNAFHVLI